MRRAPLSAERVSAAVNRPFKPVLSPPAVWPLPTPRRHPNVFTRGRNRTGGANMTPDDIAALAMTLAACTPMERLTNMEVRAVLELLKQRGYLVKPQQNDA